MTAPSLEGRSVALAPAQTAWLPALAGIAIGVGILLAMFGATAAEIVAQWRSNGTYQYAWAVLPTLAYLLWTHRTRLAELQPGWSAIGVAAAAVCGLAWLAADLLNFSGGRQYALAGAVTATVLAAVGWAAFRRLAPYLFLLVLLVPSGDFLLAPLKVLTVQMVRVVAAVAGVPFSNEGFILYFDAHRYVVIDDCAGLPFVLTTLFVGTAFGLLLYRSHWKIAGFALLGMALGIVANGLRVGAIVIYDHIAGTQMELSSHIYFQWAAIAFGFAGLFVAIARSRPEEAPPSPPARRGSDRGSLAAAVLAAILAVSAAHLLTPGGSEASAPQAATIEMPLALGAWRRTEADAEWSPLARPPLRSAQATYALGDFNIEAFVAAATTRRDEVTGHAIDLVADRKWALATDSPLAACGECPPARHMKLYLKRTTDARHIYYAYAIGDEFVAASPLELRLRRAWDGLRGGAGTARLVALMVEDDGGMEPAAVAGVLRALGGLAND